MICSRPSVSAATVTRAAFSSAPGGRWHSKTDEYWASPSALKSDDRVRWKLRGLPSDDHNASSECGGVSAGGSFARSPQYRRPRCSYESMG
jgi:hypothetical protein